jgi:hypothetical protein
MIGLIASATGFGLSLGSEGLGAAFPRLAFLVALVFGSLTALIHSAPLLVVGFLIAPGALMAYADRLDFTAFLSKYSHHPGPIPAWGWLLILVALGFDLFTLAKVVSATRAASS